MSQFPFLMRYILLFLFPALLSAQVGGRHVYEFLRLSPSARLSALGGSLITVRDGDLGLAWMNPALLNASMHKQLHAQQSVYAAGLSFGHVSYGHHLEGQDITLQGGLQYMNYGRFQRTSPEGEVLGEFRMSEFALQSSAGYAMSERLHIGAQLKGILSYLEEFSSFGMAVDVGMHYEDTAKNLSFAFVMRNFGLQFTRYSELGPRESLPMDIQMGITHRLRYLPLRVSAIAHNLQRWNILYDDPNMGLQSGALAQPATRSAFAKGVDNFFRHFIFNLEFLLGKKEVVVLRAGYNHLRGAELRVVGLRGLSGFSMGFGLRLGKAFHFDYGFSSHHFAGSLHHFGLSWRL